jgi:hypothetical protein
MNDEQKRLYIENLLEQGVSRLRALEACAKLDRLVKRMRRNPTSTWELVELDAAQRLQLRQNIAEMGVELTPNEVDGLIDIAANIQNLAENE